MTNKMKTIEFVIMLTSMIGASLMSYGIFEGFIFFAIANVFSVYFFYKKGMNYMLICQFVFGLTSMNGIYQNLIK